MAGFVRVADISWEQRNQLLAAGWRGRPGDGMEALYAPPSRQVVRAARRLADQQSARLADVPASRLLRATITTVTVGGADDGNALVKVRWRDAVLDVADYPDSYTPVVGHRVLCAVVDSQLSILHHSIGVSSA